MAIFKTIATMKKMIKNLMLVAVAAMAFVGCQNDNDSVNKSDKGVRVELVAKINNDDTRSGFAGSTTDGETVTYHSEWDGGEEVQVLALNAEGKGTYDNYSDGWGFGGARTTVELNNDVAIIKFELNCSLNSNNIVIYSPANNWEFDWDSYLFKSKIPTYQVPLEDSVDPKAHLLYAETTTDATEAIFHHAAAYGKVTVTAPNDFEVNEVALYFEDAEKNSVSCTLNVAELTGNEYWFAAEPIQVAKFRVTLYNEEGEELIKNVEIPNDRSLAFVKGRVSAFSVNATGFEQKLDTPVIEVAEDVDSVTFTWEPIDHATSYIVSYNDANGDTVEKNITETEYVFSDLDYFTSVGINVVATSTEEGYIDSNPASGNGTSSIEKSAEGELSYEYGKVDVLDNNKYKFYVSTNAEEYLLLHFSDDVKTLAAGSYTYSEGDGIVSGADSAFNIPEYPNGVYVTHWIQDDNLVFVDVDAEQNFTITVFCKRFINGYNDTALYKGVYTGTLTEEPEPEPEPIVFTSASAEDATYYGGTYKKFTLSNDDLTVTFGVNTVGNNFLYEKFYNFVYADGGYTDDGKGNIVMDGFSWEGYSASWGYVTMDVTVVDGKYNLDITVIENSENGIVKSEKATYVGDITGLGYEGDPVIVTVKSVSAKLNEDRTYSNGTHPLVVTFELSDGNAIAYECSTGNNTFLVPGDWSYVYSFTGDDYEIEYVYFYDRANSKKESVSGSFTVAYENDQYVFTEVYYDYYTDTCATYSYTGTVDGLTAPVLTPSMSLSTDAIKFKAAAESKDVTVILRNTNEAITASSDNAQFTTSVNGNVVTITANENTTENEITGVVTITCGTLSKTVSVTQAAPIVGGADVTEITISSAINTYNSGGYYDVLFQWDDGSTVTVISFKSNGRPVAGTYTKDNLDLQNSGHDYNKGNRGFDSITIVISEDGVLDATYTYGGVTYHFSYEGFNLI